jgi:hypothetical protein
MMGRALLLIVAVSVGAVIASAPAHACLCLDTSESVAEATARADAVFEGDVVSLRLLEIPQPPGERYVRKTSVTIRVFRSWKGIEDSLVTLWNGSGIGDCGYDFQLQRGYLVFATRDADGRLSTTSCSKSTPIGKAQKAVRKLGIAERVYGERRVGPEGVCPVGF